MEIKREVVRGELSGARKAALPAAAAFGGMLAPAAIYLALNAGGPGERGWGIPMATDIAFSLGVLALLGSRIPVGLKVFLLALAIVDDIGAIAVIAVFYTEDLEPAWLIASVALIAAAWFAIRAGVRSGVLFTAAAVAAWFAMHESGVHATLAGVAFGLLVPVDGATSAADSRWSLPALDNLEEELHPWTGYVIVPLFALANAGVALGSDALSDASTSRITLGVVLGLGIGKPLGIMLASWLAVRSGVGVLPEGVAWSQILGAGLIAGIGFTVSLFIAELAFNDEALVAEAKIAILGASVLMAVVGLAYLYVLTRAGARAPENG
jgi:NhaA family Na+:H+ antiporter